jgi:DNA-binding CsgD family transcriptional regulator
VRLPFPEDLDLSIMPGVDSGEDAFTRIYLAMLRQPVPTRASLVAEGIAGSVIDEVVPVMAARGLLEVHPGGEWSVHPPDVAMPVLAADLERRARSTRAAARELTALYFAARSTIPPEDPSEVRILSTLQDIGAASSDIVGGVRERVLTMRTVSPRTMEILRAPAHAQEQPTKTREGRDVETLAVYDTSVLDHEGILGVLQARIRGGEDSRLTVGLPFSCLVVDDAAAVVDISHVEPSGRGSLLIRNPALVHVLSQVVRRRWERATPTPRHADLEPATIEKDLDRRDHTILTLLAAGAADATIARQCGISQRTVERRVRILMDSLGAGTRFQAGVLAARHGLI